LLGHVAFTYIIIKLFWVARHNSLKTTRQASRFTPEFLLLLFVFANWLDFIHVGQWRMLSHNLIATVVVPSVALLPLVRWRIIGRFEAVLLFCASIIHMSTDILFGSFFIAFPFRTAASTIYPFNGMEDLVFESVVALLFLLVFIWSREWDDLSRFLADTIARSKKKGEPGIRSFGGRYGYPFIFIAFSSFSFVQLVIFFLIGGLADWYQILFSVPFAIFIAVLFFVFLRFLFSIKDRGHSRIVDDAR